MYIPAPEDYEYVEKTTIIKNPQKKEVITTSNKEKKKAVAPAAKTAPVGGKTVAGAKKGSPKRG
ncbi:MAG: hypothetical protein Q7T80_16570 [Methanoregula sp.]|nr:hypothetical protein [Methanoregula sp.]